MCRYVQFVILTTSSCQVGVICFLESIVISSDVNKAKRTRARLR